MKQALLRCLSVVIGVILGLVAVEVAAIGWLYIEDGRYTAPATLFERTQNTYVRDLTRGTGCRFVDVLYPHPYLAFVHHANPPCGFSWVNSAGLFGPEFPSTRSKDHYVVILTGGSVASYLGGNMEPPYPRYLSEELNKNFVSPNGKPWLVLNGAAGAWKEPQSFIVFALNAGAVDAVVNVSGFNEHYYFHHKMQQRLEAPASNFLAANPFAADENFGDAAIGWVMGRLAGALALDPVLGRSHAAYVLIRAIETAAKHRDGVRSGKQTTVLGLFDLPADIQANPERHFAVQLGLYQKYFRATAAVARDNGVKSAFFLQPVPAWGKTLTEEERRVAGDLSYRDTYRRIVAGMMTLGEAGLSIHDLGSVFESQNATIYSDHVHYVASADGRSLGNRLMAARVGELLAASWGLQRKPSERAACCQADAQPGGR